MCAKDNLIRRKGLLLTSTQTQLAGELATAESITAKEPLIARGNISNNILSLIAFIISYCLFADKLNIQQSLLDRAIVMLIIILVDKTQLLLILGDVARLTPSTLLAKFIPITKIRNPLLKKNAAKSRILLACADRRTRQYYLTIYVILANYEEQVLLTSIKKNCYCMYCTVKHYNFNIYVSLATDTLHLLLKGLVIKMLDFIQDILNNIYPSTVVSLLFILKAPFALHFIYAVCNLVILAQYKNIRMYRALDSICTRANSEAYYITIVKQFYSIINKKDKRYNDPKHYNEEVLYLILIIINYICYDKDRKHIAYIKAFSKVLLFNNNRQINNTTRILSIPFKFYDLSTIIRLVHLVPRDLPNLITYTTISYYVNNYID
ncbi:hypothetical protein HBH71_239980 [Parastagonospora nodorum]|nr:hypothetical protein HBH71_239980 [Parastagonospora nodorum]